MFRNARRSGFGFQGMTRAGAIPARAQNALSTSRFIFRLVATYAKHSPATAVAVPLRSFFYVDNDHGPAGTATPICCICSR